LSVLCRCLFSAVILSASFEREGPRYRSHPLKPPPISPTKSPSLPSLERLKARPIRRSKLTTLTKNAVASPQKPQQILVSSPSKPRNSHNSHPINHIPPKNSWHNSYARRRIIKAVENKQTRPISRAFAFNSPPQTIANQRIISKQNRMTTLQIQPAKAQFSLITRMF
jgi:hypothetical protein